MRNSGFVANAVTACLPVALSLAVSPTAGPNDHLLFPTPGAAGQRSGESTPGKPPEKVWPLMPVTVPFLLYGAGKHNGGRVGLSLLKLHGCE